MSLRLILIFGVAALYIGYRLFQSYRTKAGTKNLVRRLKDGMKDSSYVGMTKDSGMTNVAEAFAEELDILVERKTIGGDVAQALAPIVAGSQVRLGDFKFDHAQVLSDGSYLFVTTTDYKENSRASKGIETNEIYNLNFVLRRTGEQWSLYSDLHTELIDKNLRSEFAREVWNLM